MQLSPRDTQGPLYILASLFLIQFLWAISFALHHKGNAAVFMILELCLDVISPCRNPGKVCLLIAKPWHGCQSCKHCKSQITNKHLYSDESCQKRNPVLYYKNVKRPSFSAIQCTKFTVFTVCIFTAVCHCVFISGCYYIASGKCWQVSQTWRWNR